MGFSVTSKKALTGNFSALAYPHILYSMMAIVAIVMGIIREGLNPSIVTNAAWALFNVILFIPYIHVSFGHQLKTDKEILYEKMIVPLSLIHI